MHSAKVNINLAPYHLTQFDSIEEALATLPNEVILRWVNLNWLNYQASTLVTVEREARKEKGR